MLSSVMPPSEVIRGEVEWFRMREVDDYEGDDGDSGGGGALRILPATSSNTHFGPSFLELSGYSLRGEQFLPGPRRRRRWRREQANSEA
jgi:hypothetical protein